MSVILFAFTWRCPDLVVGPFVSFLADITNIVIDNANKITLIVHPVIIPFSTFCQGVVNSLVEGGKGNNNRMHDECNFVCIINDNVGDVRQERDKRSYNQVWTAPSKCKQNYTH